MTLREIFSTASDWIKDYIGQPYFWPATAIVLVIAIAIPTLHTVSGKKFKWTQPWPVLWGYAGLNMTGLVAMWALGVVSFAITPETFEAWRPRYPHEGGANPLIVLHSIVYVLPIAVAVSSLLYGILGGLRTIAFGLIGVVAAIALAAFNLIALIFVACYGWSTCI